VAAAAALARLGQPAAARPLTRTLKDEDPRVRAAAARALELLHGRPTAETSLVQRRDPFQR
jgi:HEAT repeat protein